jgi:outer membrane protein assembly factor BamB
MRWLLVVCCVTFLNTARAENWPAWRGPTGVGICQEQGFPVSWSSTENVAWKIPMPEPGNSTPIVWGEKLLVTSQLEGGKLRALMCFDRKDGKLLWQQAIRFEGTEPLHRTNTYCAASPVTDGEVVVAWHGSAGLVGYDLDGKQLWHRDDGLFIHEWGNASSPVLLGDQVLAYLGPGLRCLLVALDKRTGAEIWKRELPEAQSKTQQQFFGSWSTPVLRRNGDRMELLLSLPLKMRAFDPSNGQDLWGCDGLTDLVYTSPLYSGDLVVAMSGYGGAAIGVKAGPGATGDLTESRLWRHERNPQRIGSGLILGEHLFHLNEPGDAICLEVASGKEVWRQRLTTKSWCSMVYADGRIYVNNEQGETFVLEPATELKVLSRNTLEKAEMTRGSLAFSDGQIFMRTYQNLYCFGERKK